MILTPKRPLVQAKDRARLARIIKKAIEEQGSQADLNFIDVSQITDMSGLFEGVDFNGDISTWNIRNVPDYEKKNSVFCQDMSLEGYHQ